MRSSWTRRKIGEVISLEYGKPLPSELRNSEAEIPVYGANGIKCFAEEPYCDGPSIIIGRKGSAGAIRIVEEPFWPLDVTYYVKFDDRKYDLKFLYYMLSVVDLPSLATGVKPGINRKVVYAIEQPFPSLSEQKRIVAILDESFAGIDTAISNTEKNLANARELFESYVSYLFRQISDSCTEGDLSDFVDSISTGPFGSLLHKSDYVDDGVPLVNPINIVGTEIQPDKKKMIDEKTKEKLGQYVLSAGDLVIARRGEIGRCAVVKKDQSGWVCGTGCFFIRPSAKTNPDFLAYLLRSYEYRSALEQRCTGATMLNLSNKALATFRVSIPSLNEQERVLDQIMALSARCQEIESIQRKKVQALEELKQSLLNKAFAGELSDEEAETDDREAVA